MTARSAVVGPGGADAGYAEADRFFVVGESSLNLSRSAWFV